MGTHPIFESDFDCLTDSLRMVFTYPKVEKSDFVEDFHGEKIADPFSPLEEPDAEITKKFVTEQNEVFQQYLSGTGDLKEKVKAKITETMNYEKFGCPKKYGDFYYYFYNPGLLNQHVYYQKDSLDGEARVFLDANKFSEDGTSSLGSKIWNEQGSILAYQISHKGSDWRTIKFKKADGTNLPDEINNVRYSCMDWNKNGDGIIYNAYKQEGVTDGSETTANKNQLLFFHKIGTKQEDDIQIGCYPEDPDMFVRAEYSEDREYLIRCLSKGCGIENPVHIYKITDDTLPKTEEGNLDWKPIVDNFDAAYDFLTNDGPNFYFKTTIDAPKFKIIRINVDTLERTEIIGQSEHVLECAIPIAETYMLVIYLEDVKTVARVYQLETGKEVSQIPIEVGTISSVSARRKSKEMFFSFTSFTTPSRIYQCNFDDPHNLTPTIYMEAKVPGYQSDGLETKQVFFNSKDGTRVPMFIVGKKGLKMDGSNPCLLYGYGGFNISLSPGFSTTRLAWMQNMNGLFALANIRGGGEYGEEWHQAACKLKKQNCFDDFQAAGEYLVDNGFTSKEGLSILGGSNGGLLVGACANQRPDLFRAAVAAVGVMDMLRFQRYTVGHAWTSDFGSSDNKDEFEALKKISPLHNIRNPEDGRFPSVLVTTADHDDRVVPHHSLKYLAQLQETVTSSKNPLLGRIDVNAGHGAGKSMAMVIDEQADIYTFIATETGATWKE